MPRSDLATLAPAVACPGDYTAADLATLAGAPVDTAEATLRRWRRAGLVEPSRLVLAAEPTVPESGLRGAVLDALAAGYAGPAEGLARQLAAEGVLRLRPSGRPPSAWDRALAGLRADGLVTVAGVVPTPEGVAAVQADRAARVVLDRELALLQAQADRAAQARAQGMAAYRAQLEAIAGPRVPVQRARQEDPGAVGLPQRTVWAGVRR